MDAFFEGLTRYYGIDWATMMIGLYGTHLITKRQRFGFLLSAISCLFGVLLACMSQQMGYIAYNAIILFMLSRAFIVWPKAAEEDSRFNVLPGKG